MVGPRTKRNAGKGFQSLSQTWTESGGDSLCEEEGAPASCTECTQLFRVVSLNSHISPQKLLFLPPTHGRGEITSPKQRPRLELRSSSTSFLPLHTISKTKTKTNRKHAIFELKKSNTYQDTVWHCDFRDTATQVMGFWFQFVFL